MKNWQEAQISESESWLIKEPKKRREKIEREIVRYPKMIEEMGLNLIDLSNKKVLEIGGGSIGIIANLHCGEKTILEPLTKDYKKYWTCPYHIVGVGEAIPFKNGEIDVVVITNALDHCQTPEIVIYEIKRVLRAGGWLAVHNAIDLAAIHPHPAHTRNLDEFWFHNIIDTDFETVHELTFRKNGLRYGWISYERKIGQPAWAGLYRKVTGY